ncbi:transporter [Streptomyces sp. OK228]|uniref:transporter n=1 Tax=Streptomyces sp. OK228 TaxID=1882786 RepID=UPI000BD378F0|nr:transporter [Streptomyces sp. OK228]SOE32587.1 hypothetical protein SAMN05442782_9554 [Streptomyces sp. OK228]
MRSPRRATATSPTRRHGHVVYESSQFRAGSRAPAVGKVEYKRSRDQNVINQALSYLSWLHDHHHEFESLVKERLGAKETAGEIDWSNPRIVCIAGAFTHHDTVALEMIGRRIDLVSYRVFDDVLTLQLVASASGTASPMRGRAPTASRASGSPAPKSVQQYLDDSPQDLKDLFADLDETLLSYGDVQKETQLHYIAYRRIKNVATVRVQPRNRVLEIFKGVGYVGS